MTSSAAAVDDEPPEPVKNAPVTIAGGWQGLDVVNHGQDSSAVVEGKAPSNENNKYYCLPSLASRHPRTYHIFFKVLLPLFFIIVLCFLCGYFLVLLESSTEKEANDEALADIANRILRIQEIAQAARNAPSVCLDSYQGDFNNRTQLQEHMKECGERLPDRIEKILAEIQQESQLFDALTFDWIVCGENRNMGAQVKTVGEAWEGQREALSQEYEAQGMNETQARSKAIDEASGHDSCRVNTAAGALFWLTICTTIGYGNTVPVTRGGRALVYTLGFLSILVFTALIGRAGNICIVIADDFFQRHTRLKRLSKGIVAAVFWFAVLCLWLLVISGVAMSYSKKRGSGQLITELNDAFWLSFISITTVGFGDLHIPHSIFLPRDMFYLPLCLLVGFIFLANFLLKLSSVLRKYIPQDHLEEALKLSREQPETGAAGTSDDNNVVAANGIDGNANNDTK